MKRSRLTSAILLLAWPQAINAADAPEPASRPNIVYILADDLGYGDVGCYGATKIKTPNVDRLAREGRVFTDAHACSAVCSPSRYGLLTGEYPFRIGCYGPLMCQSGLIVDPSQLTLASLLKQHGYATACVGKWHLGFGVKQPDWNGELKPGPLEVGFDYYFGLPVVSSHPPFVYVENHRVVGLDPNDPIVFGGQAETDPFPEKFNNRISGGKAAHALYHDEEAATTWANKSIDWLRRNKDRPFFLYLATTAIHHPFTPAPRFKGTSEAGPYGDYVQELDGTIGEVLNTLDELKLRDRTLVIVTSDNGGMLNGGGKTAWQAGHRLNGDLLGFKFGVWEGGHRVPFIARWPGHIPAGSQSSQMICSVDMLATFAAIVNHPLKQGDGPDSVNVLPAFIGDPPQPLRGQVILTPNRPANLAIRDGDWVYIGAPGSGGFGNGLAELAYTGEVNSDVTADGKIKPDAPPAQLYNLATDPRQQVNVIREHPDIAERLRQQLAACGAKILPAKEAPPAKKAATKGAKKERP
jgi:arylsulfatase A